MAMIEPTTHTLANGQQLVLRTGVDGDAEQVQRAVLEYIDDNKGMSWSPGEFTPSIEQEGEWIRGMLNNSSEILIVAEIDGEIVGNIDFHIGTRKRLRHVGEFGMSVRPHWRGLGIGALLLGRLIEWARDHESIEKINLRVLSNNPIAIRMYERFGFQIEGQKVNEIKFGDNDYADDVHMGLFV